MATARTIGGARMPARRSVRLALAIAAGLGAVILAGAVPPAAAGDPATEQAELAELAELSEQVRASARLRALVELSGSGDLPFLVLDAERGVLSLMLDAVILREYPVRAIEVGRPRVLFVAWGDPPEGWLGRVWSGGQLDPAPAWERRELIPPDAETARATPPPVVIPPTVDEAYPVPPGWRVRYADGLTLEVLGAGQPAASGLLERLGEAATAALPGGETLRLRVVLDAPDAAALYRSLPSDGRLVVLPAA